MEEKEWVEKDRKAKRQQAGGQASLKYKCTKLRVHRSDAEKSSAFATPTHILISSFIAINFACFSILFLLHLSHTQTKTWILSSCIPVTYWHIMRTHSYTHRSRHLFRCLLYMMIMQLRWSPGQQSQPVKLIRSWSAGFML